MRPRRLALGAAAAIVVIGGGLAWCRSHAAPAPAPYAFDMCIIHASSKPQSRATWNDAVLSAVARTLAPEERASLETALGEAAVRWEAKANPVLEDLEGGDPDAPLVAWFKKGPSFLRTAQASSLFRACAPDDGFCVEPRVKGEDCAADAGANDEDRARFIQWPWGHALRFRAASAEEAQKAATALRERVKTSKTVAVVMTASDAEVTTKEPFATLRERWTEVAGLKRRARRERGVAPSAGFVVAIAPDEVIVMPRHEAMALKAPDAAIEADVLAAAPELAPAR